MYYRDKFKQILQEIDQCLYNKQDPEEEYQLFSYGEDGYIDQQFPPCQSSFSSNIETIQIWSSSTYRLCKKLHQPLTEKLNLFFKCLKVLNINVNMLIQQTKYGYKVRLGKNIVCLDKYLPKQFIKQSNLAYLIIQKALAKIKGMYQLLQKLTFKQFLGFFIYSYITSISYQQFQNIQIDLQKHDLFLQSPNSIKYISRMCQKSIKKNYLQQQSQFFKVTIIHKSIKYRYELYDNAYLICERIGQIICEIENQKKIEFIFSFNQKHRKITQQEFVYVKNNPQYVNKLEISQIKNLKVQLYSEFEILIREIQNFEFDRKNHLLNRLLLQLEQSRIQQLSLKSKLTKDQDKYNNCNFNKS